MSRCWSQPADQMPASFHKRFCSEEEDEGAVSSEASCRCHSHEFRVPISASDECVNTSLSELSVLRRTKNKKTQTKNQPKRKKKRQASPIAQIALFVFPTGRGRNRNTDTKCAAEGLDCKDPNSIGHVP